MNIYCCCIQKYVNKIFKIQNEPRSQLPTWNSGHFENSRDHMPHCTPRSGHCFLGWPKFPGRVLEGDVRSPPPFGSKKDLIN